MSVGEYTPPSAFCGSVQSFRSAESSIAPDLSAGARTFEVTHPHHPLRGRRFELVTYRLNWGEDRVYFHDESGKLVSLPATWTSYGAADPFVAIASGRCLFRFVDLLELAVLAEELKRRGNA